MNVNAAPLRRIQPAVSANLGPCLRFCAFRYEFERDAVITVPEPRRFRPIVEDVPVVPSAPRAVILRARVEEVEILLRLEYRRYGREVAGPAGAAIVFHFGSEERQVAPGACINARALLVVEGTGSRPLGAFLTQDVVLHFVEAFAPLRVGELYLVAG